MNALQIIWFLLIGVLLTGYAILDGFDLGAGMLHLFVARNDRERRVVLGSIAPVWDGNEVWLLAAGGAIFAAFPKVYATVFSGFYLALALLLLALIARGVALEFRNKVDNDAWRRIFDVAFAVGSFVPAFLFGVAIGNIVRGLPLSADSEYAGTFLGLLNPFAILVGLLSTSMFVMQGAAWLTARCDGRLLTRANDAAKQSWFIFVVIWFATTIYVGIDAPRAWTNFTNPLLWVAPALFVLAATAFPFSLRVGGLRPFAVSSMAIAMLIATMGESLFPYLVPARDALPRSLTIANASSTPLTLQVMLVIALAGVPIVLGYTIFIYRTFLRGLTTADHAY